MSERKIADLVREKNEKRMLTPGPAAMCEANIEGLGPFFGRGDMDYDLIENEVLTRLSRLTGHAHVARFQGSSTLAIEVAVRNFFTGRVLVVNSGYYAERIASFCKALLTDARISQVDVISPDELPHVNEPYEWLAACYVETSCARKLNIDALADAKRRAGAKLFLDATASIGLEEKHDLADVIAYSSCKGLLGLTGACFIGFNEGPPMQETSFYLNIYTHLEKKTTGPYHAIGSILYILRNYEIYRRAIQKNKQAFTTKFAEFLSYPNDQQPLLCTHVSCRIKAHAGNYVFYVPRSVLPGSIVCHLGEVHLRDEAQGDIFNDLEADMDA